MAEFDVALVWQTLQARRMTARGRLRENFSGPEVPSMSDEEGVRAVGMRVIETWNAHDMKAFAALYADDAEFVNVYGMWWPRAHRGRAQSDPRDRFPPEPPQRERCE